MFQLADGSKALQTTFRIRTLKVGDRELKVAEQLIDLAERTNPNTRVAWNQARDAALAAGIAESQFLPRIAVSAMKWK